MHYYEDMKMELVSTNVFHSISRVQRVNWKCRLLKCWKVNIYLEQFHQPCWHIHNVSRRAKWEGRLKSVHRIGLFRVHYSCIIISGNFGYKKSTRIISCTFCVVSCWHELFPVVFGSCKQVHEIFSVGVRVWTLNISTWKHESTRHQLIARSSQNPSKLNKINIKLK